MCKYGESKTTRIMMATVPHVTSGLGLREFQADGFLLTISGTNNGLYYCVIFILFTWSTSVAAGSISERGRPLVRAKIYSRGGQL